MEEGPHLVVPRTGGEIAHLQEAMADGDVVFALERKRDRPRGLLRPAGEKAVSDKTIRDAASLVALELRRKRVVCDDKQAGTYRMLFRVLPSALHVAMSVAPCTRQYAQRRSLRPSARRNAAQALIDSINEEIWNGRIQDALEKADEASSLQPKYRRMIAKGVLEGFVRLGKTISERDRFCLPCLLAAHKCFRGVLDALHPDLPPEDRPRARRRAALASIEGDYGQGVDIVADVLRAAGHRVNRLGSNRKPAEIVQALRTRPPQVLVITALVPITLRLAADVMAQAKLCRRATKQLMKLLTERGLHDRMEVILVGFAFNSRFAKRVGATTACRTLSSLFRQFHHRASERRRR
jgi:methanogenic corrinoid protein MtbC1